MLKDLGNQKLPRFRAGLPLLEQVTAERLNDICAMIEASRLQNGVGYTMNRSAGGTTLTILDTLITKNSKAWRISFGDEFSEMEKSMLAVYTAKDTEELPDIKFPDSAAIRSNIENAFKTFRKTPKSGENGFEDRRIVEAAEFTRIDLKFEKSAILETLPTTFQMVGKFTKATYNWAKSGFKLADETELKRRKLICNKCKFWYPTARMGLGKCLKCGCSSAKLKLASEKCPIGKW